MRILGTGHPPRTLTQLRETNDPIGYQSRFGISGRIGAYSPYSRSRATLKPRIGNLLVGWK